MDSMADKITIQTNSALTPPFSPRPIPPPTATAATLSSPTSPSENTHQNGHINTSLGRTTTGPQPREPVLDSVIAIPLTAEESLPTISGKNNEAYLTNDDPRQFLLYDLDLSRLNRIHGHLWMAGRPMRARPLHRYTMLGMEVLGTQQMDLHLLKYSTKLIVKPLPEWMLSYEFWQEYICKPADADPGDETAKGLWESAAGFLVSYVWLITTPLDLKIAHENTLLPSFVTWHWWKAFVKDFMGHVDINTLQKVNKRYHFGDLRLGRINSIYRTRFAHTHFVRGYGYNRYVIFFQRNFSWILIVFVFFSLVLSAMQVGVGLEELKDNHHFLGATYYFVVFSMISVVVVLAFVTIVFIGIFLFNMYKAITHAGSTQKWRLKMFRRNQEEGKDA
ncbi:uncharacterized protein J4E87_002928 [Alternaria ethzedia]|uniref:uncharacterized protein n=1 Tax=Alternaria ethzedia TaxID=181014 RepID=UPI0020C21DFA|nr:uncharacterized protein J4E87_002928 [Alternaria ethzedia]KAI4629742.1 hypothetical protein J4E87_002928 [Alternaria ethzedia]